MCPNFAIAPRPNCRMKSIGNFRNLAIDYSTVAEKLHDGSGVPNENVQRHPTLFPEILDRPKVHNSHL